MCLMAFFRRCLLHILIFPEPMDRFISPQHLPCLELKLTGELHLFLITGMGTLTIPILQLLSLLGHLTQELLAVVDLLMPIAFPLLIQQELPEGSVVIIINTRGSDQKIMVPGTPLAHGNLTQL